MPFTAATGLARGPEMELTPPDPEQPLSPWEGTGLGGAPSLAVLEG